MKFFVLTALLLICYISFLTMREDNSVAPLEDRELRRILKGQSPEGEMLKKSFDKILTQEEAIPEAPKVAEMAQAPAINETKDLDIASPEEIHQKFQIMWKDDEDPAMDYLREAFFHQRVRLEVKDELLDILHGGTLPKPEFGHLTREILGRPSENPLLFKKALYFHTETIPASNHPRLIKELMDRTEDPGLRDVIKEFSMNNGIVIQEP